MAEQGASGSVQAQRSAGRQLLRSATVREVLMGAQDNLTNVLAVVLGVTIGAGRADFVALAGLSAGVAEAVSMGGVLYNATRAESRLAAPLVATDAAAGGRDARLGPVASGFVTFAAALVAGLIPLAPFAFLPVSSAVLVALGVSIVALFVLGAVTGRVGGGAWAVEGLRLTLIAGLAAIAAAAVGAVLQVG
jgi:VIT1/CCC1 family predicted Fe2+/Mn2+ transporter